MGDHFAALAKCHDRRIGAADAAAADRDQQIAGIVASNARAIDAASRAAAAMLVTSAPAARAVSAIRCAVTVAAGNIDEAQPRPAHHQLLKSRRAAQSGDRRPNAPAGRDDGAAIGNIAPCARTPCPGIASASTCAMRAGFIDQIGIEHAVAAVRHGVAGFDPARGSGQWQRRIGGGADEIVGAHRPAVAGCDIARGECLHGGISAATQPNASGAVSSLGVTGSSPRSSAASAISSGVSEAGSRW